MKQSYYFIGIAGIGMSGLAKILLEQGYKVGGSDPKSNAETVKLAAMGATIFSDLNENHLDGFDVVVATSAIPANNLELQAARKLGLTIIRRSELLNQLITKKKAIAVTGTHGKTTTSSMLSAALERAGLDPLVTVGAELPEIGSNAKSGDGDFSVAEVCEYQRAFLDIHPFAAIITNVDVDHLDCYKDLTDIKAAFTSFVTQIDPKGFLVYCADDKNATEVCSTFDGEKIGYGLTAGEVVAKNIHYSESTTEFDIELHGKHIASLELKVPGEHNVKNALAVVAVCSKVGADLSAVSAALNNFSGAERRFQFKGKYKDATIIDDYAHHPTEIIATLTAARKRYPNNRIIAVFQPHQYSRTRLLLNDFADSFSEADMVVVPEIYEVRDTAEDIAAVSSVDLVELINKNQPEKKAWFFEDFEQTTSFLRTTVGSNDIVITIGAGPVNQVGEKLINS